MQHVVEYFGPLKPGGPAFAFRCSCGTGLIFGAEDEAVEGLESHLTEVSDREATQKLRRKD